MLDKIFKSNMIMGLVAIATLVVTVIIFTRTNKPEGDNTNTQE